MYYTSDVVYKMYTLIALYHHRVAANRLRVLGFVDATGSLNMLAKDYPPLVHTGSEVMS